MKRILLLLILCIAFTSNAQILKYSTFYVSGNIESPLSEKENYMMDRMTGQPIVTGKLYVSRHIKCRVF